MKWGIVDWAGDGGGGTGRGYGAVAVSEIRFYSQCCTNYIWLDSLLDYKEVKDQDKVEEEQ